MGMRGKDISQESRRVEHPYSQRRIDGDLQTPWMTNEVNTRMGY